jgi:probable F420-dependent oxidoreductase
MREYVGALRAIFDCWQRGRKLDFRGEHYRFTRMQPFFNPGPIDAPDIPIALGAVGPAMTRLAGEVADGLTTHPTHSDPRYLNEVTLPAIAAGAARSGRSAEAVRLTVGPMVATGPTPERVKAERTRIHELLTFLYSTPAYWPALELHGIGEVGRTLHQLTREGRWDDLKGRLPEEFLEAVVPCGTYTELGDTLRARYADFAHGIALPVPEEGLEADFDKLIDALRAGRSAAA